MIPFHARRLLESAALFGQKNDTSKYQKREKEGSAGQRAKIFLTEYGFTYLFAKFA